MPKQPRKLAPTLPLMHAAFLLAGLGTLLLGPILPLLSRQWSLNDAQSGLLLFVQFIGSTLGGLTVSARLERDMKIGLLAGFLGFFGFALAPGLLWALAPLLIGGFGVGRTIATVNIVAGTRYAATRAATLMRLNFTWSFGALLSPLLAASLTPHFALRTLLFAFAACFLVCAPALKFRRDAIPGHPGLSGEAPDHAVPAKTFFYFASLLFIYGGLETCLSAWLTTYALRYGRTSFVLSAYTLVLLLAGLTAGRALASLLLLRIRDFTLLRVSLVLAAALAAALALAHDAALIATFAVLLGLALAPIFPSTFAIVMARKPSASQAGVVLASSGLGAAALPALMGVLSTRTGSLQVALALPVAAALAMLGLTQFSAPANRV